MLAAALAEQRAAPNRAARSRSVRPPRPLPAGCLRDAASRGCTVLTRPVDPWRSDRARRLRLCGGRRDRLSRAAGGREGPLLCRLLLFRAGGSRRTRPSVPRKPFRRTVDEIFAGACLVATRYLDPYRNKSASFEEVLEILGEWRKIEAANRQIAVCLGMSFWKRRQVADFLRSGAGTPAFRRTSEGRPRNRPHAGREAPSPSGPRARRPGWPRRPNGSGSR